MMSLVAYGSSDESESSDNEQENEAVASNRTNDDVSLSNSAQADGEDPFLRQKSSLFTSLPVPKSSKFNVLPEDNETEVEEAHFTNSKRKESKPVRITVPSLAEFDDVPNPKMNKLQAALSGTGLFAMLPPPKNKLDTKVVNRSLIPHTLTKKAVKPISIPPPKSSNPSQLSQRNDNSDDEDGEDDNSQDFFNLDNPENVKLPEATNSTSFADYGVSSSFDASAQAANCASESTVISDSDITGNTYEDNVAYPADHESSFNQEAVDSSADVSMLLNDEGFMRLHGKRSRGLDDIQFIEVSQDDQLPRPEEWQMKSLTEDADYQPSRKKGAMPTSQQRRKHQITYLAFQARAREQELKNQWAQNNFTRRQTQAKYGF